MYPSLGYKYANKQGTNVRWPRWCERHRWRGLCIFLQAMSLGKTRWPHRRPTSENTLMGKWTNDWQQQRPRMWIPYRKISIKCSRHTRMVYDIEPQTGSHTMKIWVVASTALQLLVLERGSHIPVTHDAFTVQGLADTGFSRWLTGNHYGWEDLSSKRSSAKKWVPDFLKEMIVFLQQESVCISGVTDEEQQMSTRDRNTAGTVIPFLPKFTKGEF